MRAQNSLSRRDMLGMAVAVGSLALSGAVRSVGAQATKRIESLVPELDKIIAPSEPIQEVAEGFGAYGQKTRIRLDSRGYAPAMAQASACILPTLSRILDAK